MRNLNL